MNFLSVKHIFKPIKTHTQIDMPEAASSRIKNKDTYAPLDALQGPLKYIYTIYFKYLVVGDYDLWTSFKREEEVLGSQTNEPRGRIAFFLI
jgi:hypothetical protein